MHTNDEYKVEPKSIIKDSNKTLVPISMFIFIFRLLDGWQS